jgi:aspartyl-tRNA(Asn)/glutamyl-tRNA(Gln) amidotransferase subunit A
VVGLKPTREALSREGVAPLAWTQDTVGVLAPDAQTAAAAWSALAPDAETAGASPRVGVDRAACAAAAPAVGAAVAAALAAADLDLVDVEGPDLALCAAASVLAIEVEAAEAWGDELDRFGPQVRGALRAGRAVPRDAYLDAKRARGLVRDRMRALFERARLDALALPTVPITATPATLDRVPFGGRNRSVESLQGRFAAPAGLTGQPAVSVPCGQDADGMPIGLQLLGRAGRDSALLALAGRIGITSNH